jgi:hypothetical protein
MKISGAVGNIIVGAMLLTGCATDFSPPRNLGTPELYLEQSGDIGRYLQPGEKTDYLWPTENEGYSRQYYYLDQNLTVTISHEGRKEEPMSAETRRLVERALANRRQRGPATSGPSSGDGG